MTYTTLRKVANDYLTHTKGQNGITLIALTITIIVLLILAGVSINFILGENGIINQARNVDEVQKMAQEKDRIATMLADYQIDKIVSKKSLLTYLTEQKEKGLIEEVTDNEDGTFEVKANGYVTTIKESNASIVGIEKNTKTVKIELSAEATHPNEAITASLAIGADVDKSKCKWIYQKQTNGQETIGTEETNYPNQLAGNEITLTALEEGTYELHLLVVYKDGSKVEKISKEVQVVNLLVTDIRLNENNITLIKGDSEKGSTTLQATIAPTNSTNKQVTYRTSDVSIVTINNIDEVTVEAGETVTLKAVAGGTVTITATAIGGNEVEAECTITVIVPATDISLNKTSTSISINDKETLQATVIPADATNQTIKWSSEDTNIATVNETTGEVTAVSKGTTNIVATVEGTQITKSCSVTVTQPVTGITVSPSSTTIKVGGSPALLTANVTPTTASNKTVTWSSSDTSIATVDETTGEVTAVAPGTVTITANAKDGSGCSSTCELVVKPDPIGRVDLTVTWAWFKKWFPEYYEDNYPTDVIDVSTVVNRIFAKQ